MNIVENYKESLVYIFRADNWFLKVWPIVLIPFIPLLGVLGIFILKGWRFEMVRNLAFETNKLPDVDVILWLKRGAILWGALVVYFFVPWILCRILGVAGFWDLISDIHLLFTEGLESFFKDHLSDLLVTLVIYAVWGIISAPTFQCGMVRYVLTDNWKCLFDFFSNFYFVLRNLLIFLKFFAMWFLFVLTVLVVDGMLAATFFGVILIPLVTITGFYVTTAYELGELAHKIKERQSVSKALTLSMEEGGDDGYLRPSTDD